MRILILASAALLTACQVDQTGNNELAALEGNLTNLEVAANSAPAGDAGNPDTPVSSEDPQPAPPPQPDKPTSDCPIVRSADWQAHVNAMPGPNDNPRLIVTGQVTVPTGGYKVALRMGPVAESFPVQITVYLDATPPAGPATQALETREVRGSWRSEQRVGSVTIRCGSRILARLGDIGTAY